MIKIRKDRIFEPNQDGILNIPIAHYALINSNDSTSKIAIYGLGSCVALILYDKKIGVHAMSHIMLPTNKRIKGNHSERFPHKFADISVKDLINELLFHGAKRRNLRAAIIGGSTIFKDHLNLIGTENVSTVKQELTSLNIKIRKEHTGSNKGRIVIYDPKDDSVLIKFTGENEFKKLLL